MNIFTKFYLCLSLLIVSSSSAWAQPAMQWQKNYGGAASEIFNSVLPTTNGGFVGLATSQSFDGDISNTTDNSQKVWLVKVDKAGAIVWEESYGGFKSEEGNAIAVTSDGGFIICGSTSSTDVPGMHGIQQDVYVVKVDSVGKMEWHKAFGGTQPDRGYGICQATDGGYVFVGDAASTDGDLTANKGINDVWVVKLTSTGTISWQKNLGGSSTDQGYGIIATTDGGCVLTGASASKDGNLTKNNGVFDLWVVKLSSAGAISWQRSYGGASSDGGINVIQTKDGEYVMAGCNEIIPGQSNSGDIKENRGSRDGWVMKLRANGTIVWNKSYGGSKIDTLRGIVEIPDGTIVLAGTTESNDSDVSNLHGTAPDVWVMQLGSDGTMLWNKTYGGTGIDIGRAVALTADSGVVIVGATTSTDGDMAGNTLKGGYDTWVMKLGNVVSVQDVKPRADIKVYPTLTSRDVYITLPKNSKKPAITLTDMQGRVIATEVQYGADKITISVGNAAPGNYLLQLVYEGEQYVYKLVYR